MTIERNIGGKGAALLRTHVAAEEQILLQRAKRAGISGHKTNKGTAREHFIHDYLESHLPSSLAIGTGEIVGADSQPNEGRNQVDIVVYRREFPKLVLGGKIEAFLIESVVATIEVKSTLTKAEYRKAVRAAERVKRMAASRPAGARPENMRGYSPPSVLSLIVAYQAPPMKTIYGWVNPIHTELGITIPALPLEMSQRTAVAGPSIDAIFVLGSGFLHFDTLPVGFVWDERRRDWPSCKWVYAQSKGGSLLLLFLLLAMAAGAWLNPVPYLAEWKETPAFEP